MCSFSSPMKWWKKSEGTSKPGMWIRLTTSISSSRMPCTLRL